MTPISLVRDNTKNKIKINYQQYMQILGFDCKETDFLGLVEKLFYLSGKYDIELTVGDAAMENSFIRKRLRRQPNLLHPQLTQYSRYGPKAEITHLFRAPEKRPPQNLSITFLALILLPFLGFLIG
ncbi:hypothetical protein PIB30_078602, partial [Stylosanthes scabra]|nr:hypothetical protein [Stylosanthes scabra]